MISAGDLRHRVQVEFKVEVPDAFGGKQGEWLPLGEFWAMIERQTSFLASAERVTSGAVDSQPVARVHVRKNSKTAAITPDMRIVHGTTYYNVVSPPQDIEGRGRILAIMVTQGAPT